MKQLKKLKFFSPKKTLMLMTLFSTLTLNFVQLYASNRNEDHDNKLLVNYTLNQNSTYLSHFEKIPNELVDNITSRQNTYTICKMMELNKNFFNLIKAASDKEYLRLTEWEFNPDNKNHINNLSSYISGFSFRNFIREIHNIPSYFFPILEETKVSSLVLRDNGIIDKDVERIIKLTKLTSLDLGNDLYKESILSEIEINSEKVVIHRIGNSISIYSIEKLFMRPSIRSLKLNNLSILNNHGLYEIQGKNVFQNLTLQELNLEGFFFDISSLSALSSNTTLTSLNLSSTKLAVLSIDYDNIFLNFLKNPQLHTLNLKITALSEKAKDKIRNDRNWTDLKL